MALKKQIMILATALLATACTASGPSNNPLVRSFQYFSYLNGDDIRKECAAGQDSRYRMVFNALYEQQVRAYDIRQARGAKEGVQDSRVFSRGIGAYFDVSWDGVDFKSQPHASEPLSYDDLLAIDRALINAGFEQPAEDGLKLHSDEFYWIAMVCREGAFKYYAWTKENADIEKLPLIEALMLGDTTGVAVPPIKEPVIHDRGGRDQVGMEGGSYFALEVGNNGLKL